MPTLPPVFRIRLKTPEAFPICALLSVPRAIVARLLSRASAIACSRFKLDTGLLVLAAPCTCCALMIGAEGTRLYLTLSKVTRVPAQVQRYRSADHVFWH